MSTEIHIAESIVIDGSQPIPEGYHEKLKGLVECIIEGKGKFKPAFYCSALTSAASTIAANINNDDFKELQAKAFEEAAQFLRKTKGMNVNNFFDAKKDKQPETPKEEAPQDAGKVFSFQGKTMELEVRPELINADDVRFSKERDAIMDAIGEMAMVDGLEVLCNVIATGILCSAPTNQIKDDLAELLVLTAEFIKGQSIAEECDGETCDHA